MYDEYELLNWGFNF